MYIDAIDNAVQRRVPGRAPFPSLAHHKRMTLHAVLAVVLCLPGARAAAQDDEPAYHAPPPGTLTVKLVIDGHFKRPTGFRGRYDGNPGPEGTMFEGTVHREISGSTYLDVVTAGAANPFDEPSGPPNQMEAMQKEVEKCNGDQQCIMAVGMKMVNAMGGPGSNAQMGAALTRYVEWTTHGKVGRNCFKGSAVVRESYTLISFETGEGRGGLTAPKTWTVTGKREIPTPGREDIGLLCGSEVVVDTQGVLYSLTLYLNPELELLDTFNEDKPGVRHEKLLSVGPVVIRNQRRSAPGMPTASTPLSGTARVPGLLTMEDGSKADAVVTWTFTVGR